MASIKSSLVKYVLVIMSTATVATAAEHRINLPEIDGTIRSGLTSKEIASSEGHQGTWEEASYTDPKGTSFHVFLLDGKGFGRYIIPSRKIKTDDLPTGNGSSYETIQIDGLYGTIERSAYVGTSVAISVSSDVTLIVETERYSAESKAEKLAQSIIERLRM